MVACVFFKRTLPTPLISLLATCKIKANVPVIFGSRHRESQEKRRGKDPPPPEVAEGTVALWGGGEERATRIKGVWLELLQNSGSTGCCGTTTPRPAKTCLLKNFFFAKRVGSGRDPATPRARHALGDGGTGTARGVRAQRLNTTRRRLFKASPAFSLFSARLPTELESPPN